MTALHIESGKTYVVLKENDKAIRTFAEIEKILSSIIQLIRPSTLTKVRCCNTMMEKQMQP